MPISRKSILPSRKAATASSFAPFTAACGEIERIVTESFENGLIKADGGFTVDGRWLDKKDVSLIHEYLTDIGMTDSDSEYNRTELYIKLLSKNRDEAEEKCAELCRVYNAAGLLGGIFICIFFL